MEDNKNLSVINTNYKIATFMGIVIKSTFFGFFYRVYNKDNKFLFSTFSYDYAIIRIGTSMKFHKSWDWLIKVVEKIVEAEDQSKKHKTWITKIRKSLGEIDMSSLYDTVLDFIYWNEKIKNKE